MGTRNTIVRGRVGSSMAFKKYYKRILYEGRCRHWLRLRISSTVTVAVVLSSSVVTARLH